MSTRKKAIEESGSTRSSATRSCSFDRPAIVLGGGLTALGVTRCLARRGAPVHHLTGNDQLLSCSRWFSPLFEGAENGVELDPASLVRTLDAAVPSPAVLFPCDDVSVVAAASLSEDERNQFRVSLPARDVVEGLVDKFRLAQMAERANVPHPATVPIATEEDLRDLDDRWFEAALVKPVDSLRFFRSFGVKSFPVATREEAVKAHRRVALAGWRVVLQRYVPGPPSAHLFLDGYRSRKDEITGLLVRRRERMFPPVTGSSSSTVTVPPSEGVVAAQHLERLLASVDFHGIFSAEFKEDADDGSTRLLEVNVRPWWYVEFAARCGVDVCAMAYREALEQPPGRARSYDVGRRCVYTYNDLFAGWEAVRAGRLGVAGWMRSWIGSDRPVFAWDDPLPAFLAAWRRARSFLGRRLPGVGSRGGGRRAW